MPRIADVALRMGWFSSSCVAAKWALLAFGLLVLGLRIYALNNMLVTCSFGPNSPAHILRPASVEFVK